MRYAKSDNVIVINIIVVSSFLVFYLGEVTFQASGFLALTVLGLKLSKLEHTIISHETYLSLKTFLQYMEFVCETIIFLSVGLFVGDEFTHKQITIRDIINLVIFFILMIATRYISIGLFYPALKRLGYGINLKQYTLLSYSALRGSHGLLLALAIGHSSSAFSEKTRELIMFFMGGISILSLTFQGTTITKLVN